MLRRSWLPLLRLVGARGGLLDIFLIILSSTASTSFSSSFFSFFSLCCLESIGVLMYIRDFSSHFTSYSIATSTDLCLFSDSPDLSPSPDLLSCFSSTRLIASFTPSTMLSSPVGIHIPPDAGIFLGSSFPCFVLFCTCSSSELNTLPLFLLSLSLVFSVLSLDLDLDFFDFFLFFDLLRLLDFDFGFLVTEPLRCSSNFLDSSSSSSGIPSLILSFFFFLPALRLLFPD